MDDLELWLDGQRVARTESRDRGRKVRIVYEPETAERYGPETPLLSCSLPTPGPSAPGSARAFLEGLLPEGRALEAAASRVRGVQLRDGSPETPADAVALLAEYGLECAGAVVVVRAGEKADGRGGYRRLDEAGLVDLLNNLPTRPLGTDLGQGIRMSLAGAQPKLLLARFAGVWHEALNGAPSTHILKPAGTWEYSAENEALVMTLAGAVGLTDRAVWVDQVGGQSVFVAERYDRVVRGRRVLRLHQEDMCQALGIRPAQKYDIGRPSVRMAGVLRTFTASPPAELERLFRQVVFRVLIGDEDSHGKNHSLLLADGRVTLAPIYDSLCTLLYPAMSGTMAAPIGSHHSLLRVTSEALVDEARGMGLPAARAAEVVADLADNLDQALGGLDSALTAGWPAERVVDLVRGRIRRLQEGKSLGSGPAKPARRRVSLDEATARRSR